MSSSCTELPPGFRFHPTDEELIVHYLRNQAASRPCPVSFIPELNIYKFDPWDLPDKSAFGEDEWYFFTPRDRKYPNGARPNRATASGYWKATGTDKAIYSKSHYVGVKKALVFYRGRPPKGTKTEWIMHEYRLCGRLGGAAPSKLTPGSSMRLDDWVLCRIYQKKQHQRRETEGWQEDSCTRFAPSPAAAKRVDHVEQQPQPPPPIVRFPRSCSLAHLLEMEYMPLSQMLSECSADAGDNFHATVISFGGTPGGVDCDLYPDPAVAKSRGGSTSAAVSNQPSSFLAGPIFHY